MTISFKQWLCENYADDHTSYFGDLARDVMEDSRFPEEGSKDDFIGYIESEGATEDALLVLSDAYDVYMNQNH